MKSQFNRVITIAALSAVVLTACGGASGGETTLALAASTTTSSEGASGDVDPKTGLPVIDPLDITGDIVTAGSSTVFPLSEAVAALFEDEGYGGQITIDSIGSGAGFERFCEAGESDISNASRPIKDEEVAACESIGRTPIEFRVGTDALAVSVSIDNYFVESLTMEQLAVAFSTAKTWADVDPAFPAHPIALFSPGTDSGTFDYFVEGVFEEDPEPLLAADPQLSEDDNILVQGISGDGCTEDDVSTTCAIGYFGYAYFVENDSVIRAISVEGVEPNADNVDAGEYPLARPLFMYSSASIIEDKPQVGEYLAFYLNRVNEVIEAVGYFPAPEAAIKDGADALLPLLGR